MKNTLVIILSFSFILTSTTHAEEGGLAAKVQENETQITTNAQEIQLTADTAEEGILEIEAYINDNVVPLINQNKTDISGNKSDITSNTSSITTNSTNIATNATNIDSNSTAINENTNDISTNSNNIAANELQIAKLKTELAITAQIDVYCDQNPEALIDAFQNNIHSSKMVFRLYGSCYGDVTYKADDNTRIYSPNTLVNIVGGDNTTLPEDRAKIIPNPNTNKVNLSLPGGSSLILARLIIEAGSSDNNIISATQNSLLGVYHVTIKGSANNPNQKGVNVSHGSTLMMNNTQITAVSRGIIVGRNSQFSLSSNFPVEIQSTGRAIDISDSRVHQGGVPITIISTTNDLLPIRIENSDWNGAGSAKINLNDPSHQILLQSSNMKLLSTDVNNPSPSQFTCSGVSELTLGGWNKIDNGVIDTSTNCLDTNAWQTVINNALGL